MSMKSFVLGFGMARAIDLVLPGLGGLIAGYVCREVAPDPVQPEAIEFFADEHGATWAVFADNDTYVQGSEYLAEQGVTFNASGVIEDRPALLIDADDLDLAMEVAESFAPSIAGEVIAELAGAL